MTAHNLTGSNSDSIFRSRFNQVMAIVLWLLCAAASTAICVTGDAEALLTLVPVVLIAFLTWIGLWLPAVKVDDHAVTLVNVFSTVTVPWSALIDVETRFALTLRTPTGKYSATAAPAPSKTTIAVGKRDARGLDRSLTTGGKVRPGDLPETDSGAAAYIVRDRWKRLIESESIELGTAGQNPAVRRWHSTLIIIGSLLLVASIAVLAL